MSEQRKSFIKQLSTEQIVTFLNMLYPKRLSFSYDFYYSYLSNTQSVIVVSVKNSLNEFSHIIYLTDYDSTSTSPIKWVQYLYKIFGEEYKKAYLDNCASIFN